MDIHFFAGSNVGRVRTANEDFFLNEKIGDEEYLFIVADGMGGHQAGDVASQMACHTFLESYRELRKKNHPVRESMEVALRKANHTILKKAAADPSKRGMGTTFSAVVFSQMRAFVIHIGDSRIYLIRQNTIRRLTTDHSFVEKLVEDGKITADEARDHPQKNILYMSLGAREGFSPEILNEFPIEYGDVFVMCSDGLSNMINDEAIRDIAVSAYPQEAVETMISEANDHGGTDNITLQIIHIGSLEGLEKTKPMEVMKPRERLIRNISLVGAAGLLIVLGALFFHVLGGGSRSLKRQVVEHVPKMRNEATGWRMIELNLPKLAVSGIQSENYQFLCAGRLFVAKENRIYVYYWPDEQWQEFRVEEGDVFVPAVNNFLYLLRRSKTSQLDYRLYSVREQQRPLLIIKSEEKFQAKETWNRTIKIPNLRGRIFPDFMTDEVLVFHDFLNYHMIINWMNKEYREFPLVEIEYSESSRLFFQKNSQSIYLLYYQPDEKMVKVFRLPDMQRVFQLQNFSMDIPLALEYTAGNSVIFYLADRSVELSEGKPNIERMYEFAATMPRLVRILADYLTGEKLLFAEDGRLFLLKKAT